MKKKILYILGFILLPVLLTLLCKTLKIKVLNNENLSPNKKYITAFWHGTMLVPWYYFKNKGFAALISMSKDGDLLSNLLTKWGYKVVRGSSSQGGKEALAQLVSLINEGDSVALTPDGPRGPALKMKAGAYVASLRTSTEVVLMGVAIKKSKILKSWDKFEVPYPFTTVGIVFSEPFTGDNGKTRDEINSELLKLEENMSELTNRALSII